MNHFYTLMAKSLSGSGGKPPTLIEKSITSNGEYTAASEEADGYSKVNVSVLPSLATKAITANGTYAASSDNVDGYSEVTVDVQSGGGGGNRSDPVRFFDYDGTILYSYTKSEFLVLESMPANPTHAGLTSQGWNYSLSDAKDYVTKYGSLDIGQMYITNNGKTRIHIHLGEGRLNPKLTIKLTGTCVIDWGDGSSTDTITGNDEEAYSVHTYSTGGDYIITLDVNGTFSFSGDSNLLSKLMHRPASNAGIDVYQNSVIEVFIGSNITSIGQYAFNSCYSLTSITIPEGVISIGQYTFQNCYSLTSVTIPDTMTSIGQTTFNCCYSLTSVTIPRGITSIQPNSFRNCSSLTSVIIPEGVAYIENYAFNSCYSLTSITIPEGVTMIGQYTFYGCYSLTSVTIPGGAFSIGIYVFQNCYSLTSIIIPDTIISIKSNTFNGCYSLTSVTIPDTMTSIGSNTFSGCSGLGFIKFENTAPPTVSSSNAFSNIPTDCIIYIPAGSLSAYTSATNYPNPNTYTYVEY